MTARLSKDQRNQVIDVLNAGSTVNDSAHYFGSSRQTIHILMNRYKIIGSVSVRARPGRARVTTLRPYRVSMLTYPRNRFNQQPLFLGVYMVHEQKTLIISCKITDLAFSSMRCNTSHNAQITTQFHAQNDVNVLSWPALSPVMNPIEHVKDGLGQRDRPNHQRMR